MKYKSNTIRLMESVNGAIAKSFCVLMALVMINFPLVCLILAITLAWLVLT